MKIKFLIFFIIGSSLFVQSSDISEIHQDRLNLKFVVIISSQDFNSPEMSEEIYEYITAALALVRLNPVTPFEFYNTKDTENFDFVIEVTDTESSVQIMPEFKQFIEGNNHEAYTVMKSNNNKPVIRILMDRLAYIEQNGRYVERPDFSARLIVMLGHEIYGNVYNFLRPQKNQSTNPERLRIEREIFAFRKSILFIEGLIPKAKALNLDPKIISDLEAALIRERNSLSTWELALQQQNSYQSLNSNVLSFEARRCSKFFNP